MYLHILLCNFISSYIVILYFPIFSSCTFHILYFPMIFIYRALYFSYTVIYNCTFIFYLSYTLCFRILSLLFLCSYTYFHINLYCTSCSCNCILSSHSKAMLLISYHIIYFSYTFPLCILFLFFYIHACKYLRSGFGK